MASSDYVKPILSLVVDNTTVPEDRLEHGGGGGHNGDMESRVTRLEVEFEHVRRDLDEIKADLKSVAAAVSALPSRRDLNNYLLQGLGLGFVVMALIIGGIIGGLSWLKPDSPSAQIAAPAPPQIIVVPTPGTQPAPSPEK